MLECMKSHHPGQKDGEGLNKNEPVLVRLHPHRVRRTRHDDQKPDQGIDQKDLHNGAFIHRFFLADLAASLKKTIYQSEKDPDHRYSPYRKVRNLKNAVEIIVQGKCFCKRKNCRQSDEFRKNAPAGRGWGNARKCSDFFELSRKKAFSLYGWMFFCAGLRYRKENLCDNM